MKVNFSAKTQSNINNKRNKDYFISGEDLWDEPSGYLFVVCQGSDLPTSKFVCSKIVSEFYSNKSKNRLIAANDSIKKTNEILFGSKEYKRAELIVALIQKENLTIIHVGNCRASHLSKGNISHDLGGVTLIERLIATGHLTLEEAKGTPYIDPSGSLPWSLGVEKTIKLESFSKPVLAGDVILLSTISSWAFFVLNNDLISILQEDSLEQISDDLLALNDNDQQESDETIMVIRVEEIQSI